MGPALPAEPGEEPDECVGAPADYPNRYYPEPRVFLESQGWWSARRTSPGTASAHIHVGLCFPQGVAWSPDAEGMARLDFRIVFHNASHYRVARFRGGIACCDAIAGGGAQFDDTSVETKALIASAMPDSHVYVTKVLDLDGAGSDGRKEARFTVDLRDTRTGRRFFQSAGWKSYIDRPDVLGTSDYRPGDIATARGWYEGFGYTNASYGDFYCAARPPTVSGVWAPKVRMQPGSGGAPVTYHRAHLDPELPRGLGGLDRQPGTRPVQWTAVDRHDRARQRLAQARAHLHREEDLLPRPSAQRHEFRHPGHSVRRLELTPGQTPIAPRRPRHLPRALRNAR